MFIAVRALYNCVSKVLFADVRSGEILPSSITCCRLAELSRALCRPCHTRWI